MSAAPTIVWFRLDLRIHDNPALHAAVAAGRPIVPLYILDDETDGVRAMGGASRWWLHHSLTCLAKSFSDLGCPLVLRRGAAAEVLEQIATETGATKVVWNRRYEPGEIARDKAIKQSLKEKSVEVDSFSGSLLNEPWDIKSKQGTPYRVFTPFYKAVLERGGINAPVPPPSALRAPKTAVQSDDLADWQLRPTAPDWAGGLRDTWTPGEAGAAARLDAFLDGPVTQYKTDRDIPGVAGTSALSPHLHFGEISPQQVWHKTVAIEQSSGTETFLKELVWREFGYHLLYDNPEMPLQPLQRKFKAFPWATNESYVRAWQRGQTGYPIVDAGMRELWHTGTMHNRVRMIVASFLVKHLLVHWRAGEEWFWDTLVDADLASNTANWQWVAGCGADAAPYFRIFNPMTQGEKFDPKGIYVRRWVPELSDLPDKVLHQPWTASDELLAKAEIRLGQTYPRPIVDHKTARECALEALASIKDA